MSQPLQIGIIGAGIAGLGAAVALSRAGHSVEIFEKSYFKNEVGAAITITSNGTAVLDKWGFDFEKARATENLQTRLQKGKTLEKIYSESLTEVEGLYGHKVWFFHRVDLHEGLRDVIRKTLNHLPVVRLGAEVKDLDCEGGLIALTDGSKHMKDLVVVADGTHSCFVSHVTGMDLPTRPTGRSAYRLLVPMDKIMANPDTAALFTDEPHGSLSSIIPGSTAINGKVIVTYPCRDGSILNFASMRNTKDSEMGIDDWHSPASIDAVLDDLQDFHQTLKAIIKMSNPDACKVYNLKDHAPVPTMHRGRTVLIGDAAHPMLPTHAQGGTISLEDAAALEVLLSNVDKDEVEERLAMFSRLRVPRCATTHLLSNGLLEKPEVVEEQIRTFYTGPLPPRGALPTSKPTRDFWWGYNIFDEAKKMLRGEDPLYFGVQKV